MLPLSELEQEALAGLRQVGKRRAFQRVFAAVVAFAGDQSRPADERMVWSDIEDVLALDLETKR